MTDPIRSSVGKQLFQSSLSQAKLGRLNNQLDAWSQTAAAAPEQAEVAATQFEAMLLKQMIGAMWQTVPEGKLLSGSNEEAIYRDMLSQTLADNIAESQSIGVKASVLRELKSKNGR